MCALDGVGWDGKWKPVTVTVIFTDTIAGFDRVMDAYGPRREGTRLTHELGTS